MNGFFRLSHFCGKGPSKKIIWTKMKITTRRAGNHGRSIYLFVDFRHFSVIFHPKNKKKHLKNSVLRYTLKLVKTLKGLPQFLFYS